MKINPYLRETFDLSFMIALSYYSMNTILHQLGRLDSGEYRTLVDVPIIAGTISLFWRLVKVQFKGYRRLTIEAVWETFAVSISLLGLAGLLFIRVIPAGLYIPFSLSFFILILIIILFDKVREPFI